jgi:hypothetical protein
LANHWINAPASRLTQQVHSTVRFAIERSETEIHTSQSGLGLVGLLLNEHTGLCTAAERAFYGNPSISHADVLKSYVGILALGKSDFEALTGFKNDTWFKTAMGIKKVPSTETLRQRLDRHAQALEALIPANTVQLLKSIGAPVTPLPSGHAPLDLDVFTLDNSGTKKEGVSCTCQDSDGYSPIVAYLSGELVCGHGQK